MQDFSFHPAGLVASCPLQQAKAQQRSKDAAYEQHGFTLMLAGSSGDP
jgi:hypothetical protein